jgi:hypothetical protein
VCAHTRRLVRTRDIIVVVVARLIVESEKSKLLFHPRDSGMGFQRRSLV